MRLGNDANRWGAVAIALHWLVATLIVTQYVLANIAEAAEESGSLMGQLMWWARHKSVGITILGLAVLRLGWRLANVVPEPPMAMPGWQWRVASITHGTMYLLIFALPLTGWAMSSAAAFPVSWFGVVTLPDLVAASETNKEALAEVHESLAGLLFAVAVLHIAAALKHQFFDRDGLLARMFGAGGGTP